MLYDQDIEYMVRHVVGWAGYVLPLVILLLLSALWHLILLVPALNKTSDFIRWHGRQALMLAGIRTAVPVCMVLLTGDEYGALYAIPILLIVWLFGTLWGQLQAARGNCSLMRWFGRGEALPHLASVSAPVRDFDKDPDALVDIIRFDSDPQLRRAALTELEKLGMVERLDGLASPIPISTPRSSTDVKTPVKRSGGGCVWLVVIAVLVVLWGVSSGSSVYRGRSAAATRQTYGTATIVAGMNATATAQAMQSVREAASRWPLVLQSNFESLRKSWDFGDEDNEWLSGKRRISDGMYLWEAQAKKGSVWWSIPETDRMFFDFYLTVESERVIGPEESEYGVIFRYKNEDNFYVYMVEDNLSARVEAKIKGDWVTLSRLTIKSIIHPGEVNRLTVVAEGPNITLFINDEYVGEFEDNQFGYGEAGLVINLKGGDYGRFSFDNFELRAPVPEAGEKNRLSAIRFANAGMTQARQGDIEDAISYFAQAQASDPEGISANSWNGLCWFGSLWGYAAEVMEACEMAVALDPEHGGIRDSRGVARAIMGDYTGAIEDFNFYVEWAKENYAYGIYSNKREAWITELENGRNPFDEEMLESLKHE
jgi:tetratricopeptide (TPR) repeat protein